MCTVVKFKVEISQNLVAFSEYMNHKEFFFKSLQVSMLKAILRPTDLPHKSENFGPKLQIQ